MTMLSFRVDDRDASRASEEAARLGIDRSELLRRALTRQLAHLAAERDALTWERVPLDDGERAFEAVAEWAPAEDWSDWSDWADAAR